MINSDHNALLTRLRRGSRPRVSLISGSFRSLANPQYRLWAAGALVSNVGTWMQRTAQDWLVLTQLTAHSAAALGVVSALQFGPQLLFLPWTGYAADRFDRRRLVMVTQAALGVLALLLGLLVVSGAARLWHVYTLAFLSGSVAAFDGPARQTFVADLVTDDDLANAVALNSTSFNAARTVGPALAGVCIAAFGTGWAILVNGLSFLAVLASLRFVRRPELPASALSQVRSRDALTQGIRYIAARNDLRTIVAMLALFGAFGLNFPIFISTMSVAVFGVGAGRFGLLMSLLAIGTTIGALLATTCERPSIAVVTVAAAMFGIGLLAASLMPGYWWFAAVLLPVGIAALTVTNVTNSLVQLSTVPDMRGRVLAIRMSVLTGFSFIGAPLIGQAADRFGPRWAVALGGLAGLAAAAIGLRHLRRMRRQCVDLGV